MEPCILWTGSRNADGYGTMSRNRKAHRVAWEHERGPIPAGMSVLHRCDTPACVNVAHLFLGTQADNMADMMAKGRGARHDGVHNGQAKLSAEDVRAIRADTRGAFALARAYDVAPVTIWRVKTGRAYARVGR